MEKLRGFDGDYFSDYHVFIVAEDWIRDGRLAGSLL